LTVFSELIETPIKIFHGFQSEIVTISAQRQAQLADADKNLNLEPILRLRFTFVNFYSAAGSLARVENKNILYYFEKRSSLGTTTLAL
jgi:hypothetical protein